MIAPSPEFMPRQTVKPRPATKAARNPPIEGGLIGIERDGVIGWARDLAHPDEPVQVRLMAGGEVLAEAIANQFEDARIRTLAGPGIAGFIARLATAPRCPAPFQLSLHDSAGRPLGAPLPIRSAAELAPAIGLPPAATYEGNLDGLYDGALKGWARDGAEPDAALEVELLDNGAPVSRVTAHLLREDLRAAGLHSGLYGFSFELPVAMMDGRVHSLTVRIADSATTLRGGPVSFGPLATSALLTQMAALQGEVAALRQTIGALTAPDGPAQRRILRLLAERLAAQAEIEHDQMQRELAALRAMVFAAADRTVTTAPEHYAPKPQARSRRV
jgi:hypothetical protein